jgi:glycosyltransferase involved in cell wall biosynthesis
MRIAYVINSVEGGGAALPVPAITRVLRDAGAEVRIFALTRRDGRALPPMAAAGLEVDVREGGEKDHIAAYRWLDDAVRAWRPTHIWTSLTRATLLGQLVGARRHIPVVSWQHAAFRKTTNRLLLRANQRLSALWVGDSESVTALTGQRLRVPPERLTCWPIFAANADAPQARPWQPGDIIRVGSLGRIHPVKGYDVLVSALAQLRAEGFTPPAPFEVVIAGDGAQTAELEAMASAAGIDNLCLSGFAERPQDFLSGLHLYVQPSRSEGLCVAMHEAMQASLGVIASAVGEMRYSIEPGISGQLVPPGDAGALANALADMLSDPERLAIIGAQARERVLDRFGSAAFAARGAAIVERMRLMAR